MKKPAKRRMGGGFGGYNLNELARLLDKSHSQTRYIFKQFGTYNNNNLTPADIGNIIFAVKMNDELKTHGGAKSFPHLYSIIYTRLRKSVNI